MGRCSRNTIVIIISYTDLCRCSARSHFRLRLTSIINWEVRRNITANLSNLQVRRELRERERERWTKLGQLNATGLHIWATGRAPQAVHRRQFYRVWTELCVLLNVKL